MFGAAFVPLPMHCCGPAVEKLHAIHAHVSLIGLGIPGNYLHQGDIATTILWPAFQYGQQVERCIVSVHNFLARSLFYLARLETYCAKGAEQLGSAPHCRSHAIGKLHVDQTGQIAP